MCMKRDLDDSDRPLFPFPLFDFVDLTMDELAGDVDEVDADSSIDDDDDDELATPARDMRNYPYNLLPSMQMNDNENPVRFINYANLLENSSDDVPIPYDYITEYNNFFNNDIPTNTNTNITNTASVINAIHANIAEINNTDNDEERQRRFELNIPQILLSMSAISHNLLGQIRNINN
ncbi:uncharacterized protein LOC112683002 [Sipha flava]|uniref:Uncharacterized protein LOC112683002 n=1 Tax=Sipha flava TaxID=143950 RepID=A0A2S2Q5T6_9HEMI|nr:uncharacterized protein LOC112683002 [Sipha flava]XP_025409603.1 uncharacterized protein LOC112683002 [Sipha flava]XP_025409604.1 uncharacterized protein LOC112683002 [Sipha flava]XP_025409605.1 uncharacterized protein LOC112683002 [Sipha flava]